MATDGPTTDDEEGAHFARRMRYNGEDQETGEYHGHGFTCLLDNLQAAFLDIKLRHLPLDCASPRDSRPQMAATRSAFPSKPQATQENIS